MECCRKTSTSLQNSGWIILQKCQVSNGSKMGEKRWKLHLKSLPFSPDVVHLSNNHLMKTFIICLKALFGEEGCPQKMQGLQQVTKIFSCILWLFWELRIANYITHYCVLDSAWYGLVDKKYSQINVWVNILKPLEAVKTNWNHHSLLCKGRVPEKKRIFYGLLPNPPTFKAV